MSEALPINAAFVLTLDEIKAARSVFSSKKSPSPQLIVALVFILGLVAIAVGVLSGRMRVDSASWNVADAAVILGAAVLFYIMFKRQSGTALQRSFLRDPAANRRVELRFSQEGLASKLEGLPETTFPWSGLVRVRRTPAGFLFYKDARVCIWVPAHAFASTADADAVAALARERVPTYSES